MASPMQEPNGKKTPIESSPLVADPHAGALDSGGEVLVHRDEHWLVRDLALQSRGPRQVPIGSGTKVANCLTRLERRHKGDYTWEAVDHMTRRVRPCEAPSDDEHGDDCDGCEKC